MEKIKFTNNSKIYDCTLTFIKDNVFKITCENLPNKDTILTGFKLLNENNLSVMSDFSNYNTEYKTSTDSNIFYISTGEIFEDMDSSNIGNNKLPELSEEELLAQKNIIFKITKENKINELRIECKKEIENGVNINGEQYSYTVQDQSNLLSAMDIAKETGLDVPYHADNTSCSLFNYSSLISIYIEEQMNLIKNQTYFNQLKLYINSFNNPDEIETIKSITYGTVLVDCYLENYNAIIKQSEQVLEKLISK